MILTVEDNARVYTRAYVPKEIHKKLEILAKKFNTNKSVITTASILLFYYLQYRIDMECSDKKLKKVIFREKGGDIY